MKAAIALQYAAFFLMFYILKMKLSHLEIIMMILTNYSIVRMCIAVFAGSVFCLGCGKPFEYGMCSMSDI